MPGETQRSWPNGGQREGEGKGKRAKGVEGEVGDAMDRQTDAAPSPAKFICLTKIELPN